MATRAARIENAPSDASRSSDRRPSLPIDAVAEESVIAGLLTSPEAYLDVAEFLRAEDFGVLALGDVYRAIQACDSAGRPFDQVTVAHELARSRTLSRVGGRERLAELVSYGSGVDNVMAHAHIVADKAQLRRLVLAGREIASIALDPSADVTGTMELAERAIFEIGQHTSGSSLTPMSQAVASAVRTLAESRGSALLGVPTSLTRLDAMTAGLQPGQLIILAARPGVGKSALALQMARHMAEATGQAIIFNSFEMSAEELVMRLLSSALNYDGHQLRQGNLPDELVRDLGVAAAKLAELPLFIDDRPPVTITQMRSAMRRVAARQRVGAIFVDYLQLMQGDGRYRDSNRTQEVGDISRGLKLLATELDVPIVALSQLNRGLEARMDKRPMLSDLRESGSLEQDANAVLFLYRESLYSKVAEPTSGELIVAKQRSGPTGTIHLRINPASSRIEDVEAPTGGFGGGTVAASAGRSGGGFF